MKRCKKCGKLKWVNKFYKSETGYRWKCIECCKKYQHAYNMLKRLKPVVEVEAPAISPTIYLTCGKWLIVVILIVVACGFVISLGK